MADERKNIDNLFRDHLVGHKASAPHGAWERLHADLQPSKRGAVIMYIRLAAASLLLLLAFGTGYFLSEYGSDNTNLTASKGDAITIDGPVGENPISPVKIPEIVKDDSEAGEQEIDQMFLATEVAQ